MTMTDVAEAPVKSRLETQIAVEQFLYAEAALLDAWDLDGWLALFTLDCKYEVTPTGIDKPFEIETRSTLFLIGDNRERLEQRVIRLKKPTAHVEFPKSKTRHLYANVRIVEDDGDRLVAMANFCTFRTKNKVTTHYPGSIRFILQRDGDGFRIRGKRVVLDLEALIPQGKVSIIL